MPTVTSALIEPLELPCGQILSNRLMKSAMSETLGDSLHSPTPRLERLYQRWGAGGYGLVVTGNVMVDRSQQGEVGNVVVEDDRDIEGLTRWAKTTQDGGAAIWMQINHPGRQANPLVADRIPVAPSAIGTSIPGTRTPRALSGAEIEAIIERFVITAAIAEASGFNGVQIHGAHGYLVAQFLSPLSNQRTDKWGGDITARSQFLLEIVRRIRATVSPSFGVGVKLNSADFQRGGFTEEESRAVVAALNEEAVDLIEISGGTYESPAMMVGGKSQSTRDREAYFLEYAQTVRSIATTSVLAVTGGFRSRLAMEEAVASKACDLVGIGRPACTTPEAAKIIFESPTAKLDVRTIELSVPKPLAQFIDTKVINGALDIQWHANQIHLIGEGKDPDLNRPLWKTMGYIVKTNGTSGFRQQRGKTAMSNPATQRAIKKFHRERIVGRYFANPLTLGLAKIGIRPAIMAELETIGRKSGQPRVVPVSVNVDSTGAWLISQHGRRAGWAYNITDNPKVRLKHRGKWLSGTAEFHPEDDVDARGRTFMKGKIGSQLSSVTLKALQSDPISVRITFDSSR
ncbi:MAG: nitroreductase family deazaflavin-dependent oxidoreductase [Mycobacteriaceae bacterium]